MRLFNEPEVLANQDAAAEAEQPIIVSAHQRRRSHRKPLPDHLPRLELEHDLSEEQKVCSCGCQLSRIGAQPSEQLDIIPAKIQVIRHIRHTYACKGCEQTVHTAALPPQPIPKSNASPGLLAHIAVAKYQDALPLARQEKLFARIGAELPRSTLARWMIQLGTLVQPLVHLIRDRLLSYDYIGMDETRIQVLKEPDREATSQSCIWVQRGGPPDQPLVLFHYDRSKAAKVAETLLEDYGGYLQVDGNATYDTLAKAHPAIRPFVIGRRNWLFADTPKGAAASANLYSLIETAKANGVEPYHYLRYIFTELPKANTLEQIESLLPFNLPPEPLSDTRVYPSAP